MIKCDLCLENLSAYVDGELPENKIEKMNEHLKECDSCSKELELLKAIVSICEDLTEDVPESFETSLHKRLVAAKDSVRTKKKNRLDLRLITQVAAGFILIISVGIVLRFGSPGGMKSMSDNAAPESVQMNDRSSTLAMTAQKADTAKGAMRSSEVTIAGSQDVQKQDQETERTMDDKIMFSMAFTEEIDANLGMTEGYDTQVRIETKDLAQTIENIIAIDEKLSSSDNKNKNKLQGTMFEFGGTQEELVQVGLYYPNGEAWNMFLSELRAAFPDMVIELVPSEEEKEHIRII
ncbi:MAG: zf-HC2 domain-containing protein, partial [Ruminiclostridium sp.]|nr:zf-HC2 domain-containing protein [Ruminiclostridium sp.]